jgi:hypothetical protein
VIVWNLDRQAQLRRHAREKAVTLRSLATACLVGFGLAAIVSHWQRALPCHASMPRGRVDNRSGRLRTTQAYSAILNVHRRPAPLFVPQRGAEKQRPWTGVSARTSNDPAARAWNTVS